jgi:hypothetical protein
MRTDDGMRSAQYKLLALEAMDVYKAQVITAWMLISSLTTLRLFHLSHLSIPTIVLTSLAMSFQLGKQKIHKRPLKSSTESKKDLPSTPPCSAPTKDLRSSRKAACLPNKSQYQGLQPSSQGKLPHIVDSRGVCSSTRPLSPLVGIHQSNTNHIVFSQAVIPNV